ncbi:MAG: hypothetical protein P8183_05895 [Anaerolineae bacterium]
MLKRYFEAREFIVEVNILDEEWSETAIVQACRNEKPDALIIWDSDLPKMLSSYNTLKKDIRTTKIAIALIMVRQPDGFTELPEYLFVHPFQIDKVEAIIRTGCHAH